MVKILANNVVDGATMKNDAEAEGMKVDKVLVWDGPCPDGSFTYYAPGVRMSTPEYYFLRKANWLPFGKAVCLANELIGKYRSALTEGEDNGDYDFLRDIRTDKECITAYLSQIDSTPEGKLALEVLDCAVETCATPVANYLATMLSLPAKYGGYGLSKPETSAAFTKQPFGFMPDATGRFLVYDLFWKKGDGIAVQYAEYALSDTDKAALDTNGVKTHVVFKDELSKPGFLDNLAAKVAELIGEELPEKTQEWVKVHADLVNSIEVPAFENMESTYESFTKHLRYMN